MSSKAVGAKILVWMLRLSLGLTVLAVGVCAWLTWRFEASKPQLSGQAHVAGLGAPARIVRDMHGVPHIFAASAHDVYFALGYAHAQDRFFQMDLTRRSVEGRLAELVGELALRLDAKARIKNFNAVIAAQTASLSPGARDILQAYTDGVNAELANAPAAPEYDILFLKPERWRVEDSVAVGVAMTNDLTLGTEIDIARLELAAHLNAAQFDEFFPPYPAWAARSLEGPNANAGSARAMDRAAPGSNAWALAGARTASGKPLLANDPHLDFSAPGPFYLVHLKPPDGDLIGATLPGAPVIVIGRNDHLAWTNTTNQVDSADVIGAPPGGFADVRTRTEKIVVRDWFNFRHTKTIEARDTANVPLLDPLYFDIETDKSQELALHSAALDRDNRLVDAILAMNSAQTLDQFTVASAGWTAPMTHVLVASTNGDIGLVATGALPRRDKTGTWAGSIPRSAQPNVKNPPDGFIVTANNLATPDSFPFPMPGTYTPYRIARIRALLDTGASRDLASAGTMQTDLISTFAARVAPALTRGAKPQTEAGRAALKQIAAWNGDMSANRAEPLIFAAWIDAFSRRLYADKIGDETLFSYYAGPRRAFVDSVLTGSNGAWCDDKRTPRYETCADVAGPALDDAMRAIERRYGADRAGWTWGRAHRAIFPHPLFAGAPLLGDLFNVSIPIGGDGDTIFAGEYFAGDYHAIHGPSLRVVFDLADLNRSRYMIAPGQSGHPLSPHYRDLIEDWAAGRSFEIRDDIDPERPPAGFTTLILEPR